jgi:hypothetical protein
MHENDKAVLRFNDGKILKGYIREFAPNSEVVALKEAGTDAVLSVDMHQLKAIFFVKSFDGDRRHREKKSYASTKPKGNRIFIKFKDKEDFVGFLEGQLPWKKGFFLSSQENMNKGFFLLPADEDSNNIKAFVITTSVIDVTVIP